MILFFCDHSVTNHPKPHTLTFLHRLQLIHFFLNCVHFYLGPTGPAAVVVVSSVCSDRKRERESGATPLSTPSWCVRLITQPSDPEVTSSTESVTFHGRCKSIHLCQASASILAFPELAYWSLRNAWVRTSCFLLLKMGIVSPLDSSVKVYCCGPNLPSSKLHKIWRTFVIQNQELAEDFLCYFTLCQKLLWRKVSTMFNTTSHYCHFHYMRQYLSNVSSLLIYLLPRENIWTLWND